jgi:hypothetical protein
MINENKMKYLYCTRQASRNVQIFEETKIEKVNHLKYLGCIVTRNNNNLIEDEIKERIAQETKIMWIKPFTKVS